MPVGSHVPNRLPLEQAEVRQADLVQFFLSNPQSWKKPLPREDAAELREASLPIYVHAPYLINVASPNNRVRIPSRKILDDTCRAAEEIGARAVIVHGGHVGDDEQLEVGAERWRKALERLEPRVQILIENTAAGGNAVSREISSLGVLWEAIGDLDVGFCLDTCHAWASGEELETVVERALAATGRLDLVHCNDSRDPAGSCRDRHEHPGQGMIPPETLVGVAKEAGAPVIVESRGEAEDHARDIAWLRQRLG
ncbi:MAG: deoxyribonuclease IV [Actinomycetota bacterium]|nr:deoxyribonuclease IV [Actinomycetota bacterium]